MSKNRRNFHYHYAEQYETRADRRRVRARYRARYAVAPVAIIPALVLLLLLGLMSTAFSSYVQSPDSIVSEAARTSSALAQLKDTVNSFDSANRKADLAPSGAQAELSDTSAQSGLADTGANPDISDSAAKVDRAPTSATALPVGMRIYLDISSLTGWDNAYARFCSDANGNNIVTSVAVASTGYSNRSYVEVPSGSYQSFFFQRGNGSGEWWNKSNVYTYSDIFETTVYISDWNSASSIGMANWVFYNGKGRIYFDNSVTQWTGRIYLFIGKGDTVRVYQMNQVANTGSLYYLNLNETNGEAYVFFGFAYKSSGTLSSSYSTPGAAYNAATGYTTVYSNWEINDNSHTYVSDPSSSNLPTDIKFTYQSSGYNYFDDAQTLNVGANGTAVISGYEMTGNGTATATSRTVSAGSNGSINAAKSSVVSVTPHPSTGYGISSVTLDGNALADTDDDGIYTYVADGSTHTVEVTFFERNYCSLTIEQSDFSLDVNETRAITVSASHHASGDVTISSNDSSVSLSTSQYGTYTSSVIVSGITDSTSAIVYVKGISPTSLAAAVTASCGASHTNTTPATVHVTVDPVSITYPANSYELFYDSSVSVGSVTYSPASELASPVSYDLVTTDDGTDTASSLASTDGTDITGAGTSVNSNTTHYLKITVGFNTSYSVTEYKPVTIKPRPNCYLQGFRPSGGNNSVYWADNATTMMTYSGSGVYTKSVWLDPGKVYGSGSYSSFSDEGFKIHYNSTYYAHSGDSFWFTPSILSTTLTANAGNNMCVDTRNSNAGFYVFTYNADTRAITIEYPAQTQYFVLGDIGDAYGDVWYSEIKANTTIADARRVTDGSTFTINANSAASNTRKSFEFKVYCTNGKFFGTDTNIKWESNEAAWYTNENQSYSLSDGTGNVKFYSWYAGDYTFAVSNLSTSGCTLSLSDSNTPQRAVTNTDYFLNTTTAVPTGNRRTVTITDNHNDTWTVSVPDAEENDYYTFANWNNIVTNMSTSGGVTTGTVTLSTSNTSASIISYWQNKTYTLTLFSWGAILPTNLTGATYTRTEGSGDDLRYIYSYTYGTAVTLPDSAPFTTKDSTWTFGDWYENSSDFSGTGLTSLANTTYGNKTLYPKITIHVYFKDNIVGNVIKDQQVLWNTDATAPALGTDSGQLNVNAFNGFTIDTSSSYWKGDLPYTSVKTGKNIYAEYRPLTESNVVTGEFTPNDYVESVDDLYRISFGAVIAARFTADSAYTAAPQTNIKYQYCFEVNGQQIGTWTDMTKGSIVNSKQQWTAQYDNIATMMTRPSGAFGNGIVKIKFTTYFRDLRGDDVYASGTPQYISLTYQVVTPLQSFTVSPFQRIYSSTALPSLTAAFKSYHNNSPTDDFADITKFRAVLYKGSSRTQVGSVGLTHGVNENYTADFNSLIASDFANMGVKYYSMEFQRKEEGQSYFVVDTTASDRIHTTVGTTSFGGYRPVFLNADASCGGYGVMLFYINNNALSFQTGESYTRTGQTESLYRFNIPSSVTEVTFALVDTAIDYEIPTISNGSVVFTNISGSGKYYKAYNTADVTGYNSVTASLSGATLTLMPANL